MSWEISFPAAARLNPHLCHLWHGQPNVHGNAHTYTINSDLQACQTSFHHCLEFDLAGKKPSPSVPISLFDGPTCKNDLIVFRYNPDQFPQGAEFQNGLMDWLITLHYSILLHHRANSCANVVFISSSRPTMLTAHQSNVQKLSKTQQKLQQNLSLKLPMSTLPLEHPPFHRRAFSGLQGTPHKGTHSWTSRKGLGACGDPLVDAGWLMFDVLLVAGNGW